MRRADFSIALLLAVGMAPLALAQATRDTAQVIDDYVALGLQQNLALRAATLDLQSASAAVSAAKARFFPELALAARYTEAEGGRQIELPLAELLNPAYQSLNDLLNAAGRPPAFGRIENQAFAFLRDREQDTRLTLRQPLYAPAIPAALRAQTALMDAGSATQAAVARRLKRDIGIGYLQWQRANNAVAIVDASRLLLEENLRVNESLYRNGKVTQDRVLRSRAELLAVVQQLTEAKNAVGQSRSYFNFLLNRPLDEAIEASAPDETIIRASLDLAALQDTALQQRPEFAQAAAVTRAAAAQSDIVRAAGKPSLVLAIDAGTQGESYSFGRGSNFSTISLLLNWTLFDAGARRAEVRAARLSEQRARLQQDLLAIQVRLEVQQSLDQLQTALDSLTTAVARAEAARAAFRIASRKRDEAVISQVEFIDARAALTGAELNLALARFDVLARQAELDFATAAGALPAALGLGN